MHILFYLLLMRVMMTLTHATRIVHFPPRQILDYRGYDDVTVFHYNIPEQIQEVSWNFTAWEVKQSASLFKSCDPRPMTAHLKHGSLPVVNPDGGKFPAQYYLRTEQLHNMSFASNKTASFIRLSNPEPGDWYAIVYNDYTDPADDEIVQSGLSLVCAVIMEVNVDITTVAKMTVIVPQQSVDSILDETTSIKKFKFFVPDNTSSVRIDVNRLAIAVNYNRAVGRLNLETTARSSWNSTLSQECDAITSCTIQFVPSEHTWYFLTMFINSSDVLRASFDVRVDFTSHNGSILESNVTAAKITKEFLATRFDKIALTRQTYTGFFTYGFSNTPLANGTYLPDLYISTTNITLLSFEINPISDIGGVLSFEITLNLKALNVEHYHVVVLACLGHELQLVPQYPNTCLGSSGQVFPNLLRVNSSSELTKTNVQQLHVPFPESGFWHLSLMAFCYQKNDSKVEVPCTGLDTVNMTFLIESDMCDPTRCGTYGRCYTHMSGGFAFATCICHGGYRGWGCTDSEKVTPRYELLLAALLLTLSNLLFIPAIVISIKRRYYTEALVYTFIMFFSTFYHACDAGENVYSYCIIRGSVLQFCDFFSAVLAIWVTIIAMANLPHWLCSLAHMAGAVMIALGTEYSRRSLWLFMIPIVTGLTILALSWGMRMRRSRSCYPHKKYWKFYLPSGLLLIIIGLVCYAYLETTRNYKYVHSFWHAVMALSILIVLPMREFTEMNVITEDDQLEIPTGNEVVAVEDNGRTDLNCYSFCNSLKFWKKCNTM